MKINFDFNFSTTKNTEDQKFFLYFIKFLTLFRTVVSTMPIKSDSFCGFMK